jgi:NAD-dependent deacetylase
MAVIMNQDIGNQEIADQEIIELREMISSSARIVVFTGAGISTESGIPDFRGPDGIWKKISPIEFHDFVRSEEIRRESWSRKFSGSSSMAEAEPNAGHIAINELIQAGKISHVITQNVDGLHNKSGVPDNQIIELHGNANYATCLDCHQRYELSDIERSFLANGTIPYCESCQGIVKTATISFGQSMPIEEMQRAEEATFSCDMFISIGSSLVVYPAAGFPRMAKQNGAKLVIINNDPTDLDPIADLVIHKQIGVTLTAAVTNQQIRH